MKKAKKVRILLLSLCLLIAAAVCVYIVYSLTLINPGSEESLRKHLGLSSDSRITVLARKKYNDYLGIYYKDSNESADITSFVYLRENKICKNKYDKLGGGSGNQAVSFQQIKRDDDSTSQDPFYFIYGQNVTDNSCTVFECGSDGHIIKKTDEIPLSSKPFVIVKNYRLSNPESDIFIFEGKVSEKDVLNLLEESQ